VDLRVIYLSGIWIDVVRCDLQSRPQPQTIERKGRGAFPKCGYAAVA
jgi:hypothetical protein